MTDNKPFLSNEPVVLAPRSLLGAARRNAVFCCVFFVFGLLNSLNMGGWQGLVLALVSAVALVGAVYDYQRVNRLLRR